jgi:hypothetical protein
VCSFVIVVIVILIALIVIVILIVILIVIVVIVILIVISSEREAAKAAAGRGRCKPIYPLGATDNHVRYAPAYKSRAARGNGKQVNFATRVVSRVIHHRYENTPDEADELFYTGEEEEEFWNDKCCEEDQADMAGLTWTEWTKLPAEAEEEFIEDERIE